ncbi:MAG: hypothetical protein L0212_12870 [Acidobacteria bacterium]|nr:hypothetical protein [Acidobacteriota bacterium]
MSLAIPVQLTSLDPTAPYSESCSTFVVNRHGCGLRAPRPLALQTQVRLEVGAGKASAQARVVMCAPTKDDKDVWEMGIELDAPENIWGIQFPPADWITGKSSEPLRPQAPSPAPRPEPELRLAGSMEPAEVAAKVPPAGVLSPPSPPIPTPAAVASAEPTTATIESAPACEVSYSLDEISSEDSPSAPPEVQPVAPPSGTPPAPQPTAVSSPELEAELRQKAIAISAEFEESYRRSLGELLMRLRADLEEQTAADWQRNRQGALESLQAVAQKIREQFELESAARATSDAALAAQLEEVRQARDYVESLIRVLPETIDHRLQEALSAPAEQWQNRLNEEHSARQLELRAQLQKHSQALTDELAAQARQRLFDDLDRHEREFLDRIAVRLEEVRASANHTREFTKRTSAEIARQSEQLRVDLQTQFDSLFEEHRRDLAVRLEGRHQQLSQAAHSALQNLGGRLWESFRERMNANFETRARELRETLQAAQAETRQLREHTEKLAARLDINLQARLDEAVALAGERAQTQLEQLLASTQEQARTVQAHVQEAWMESMQAQQAALLAEFRRETEAIGQESRMRFQDALRETLDSISKILGPNPGPPGTNVEPGATDL